MGKLKIGDLIEFTEQAGQMAGCRLYVQHISSSGESLELGGLGESYKLLFHGVQPSEYIVIKKENKYQFDNIISFREFIKSISKEYEKEYEKAYQRMEEGRTSIYSFVKDLILFHCLNDGVEIELEKFEIIKYQINHMDVYGYWDIKEYFPPI